SQRDVHAPDLFSWVGGEKLGTFLRKVAGEDARRAPRIGAVLEQERAIRPFHGVPRDEDEGRGSDAGRFEPAERLRRMRVGGGLGFWGRERREGEGGEKARGGGRARRPVPAEAAPLEQRRREAARR